MNGIGHVFDERPLVVVVPGIFDGVVGQMEAGYTVPPRGSIVTKGARTNSNLCAVAPDGSEWALLVDAPAWVPTGNLYLTPITAEIGNERVPPVGRTGMKTP